MRLLWRIYLGFFACALLALAGTVWRANRSLRQFYIEQAATDLLAKASVLASEIEDSLAEAGQAQIDRRCKEFGRLTQARVTVVAPDGSVIGDSDEDPLRMENHGTRPEIDAARAGATGRSVRFSDTIRRTLLYLAVPVRRDGAVVAVVRASRPLWVLDWALRNVYRHVALGAVLAMLLSGLLAFSLARRLIRPLEEMRQTAVQLAAGNLAARVPVVRDPDLATLARTLNQMAAQLQERLETITRQSDQQKAVLSSMVEGVFAVNGDGRILDLNPAAARLLDLDPAQTRGRTLEEAVRNEDLQRFVAATLAADLATEAEIMHYGSEERCLQLHGTALREPGGRRLGALVVLNDITRVKRLEAVRREFVANVSHELKTPITALRGCVETLAEPSHRSPEDTARFLAMLDRHARRLGAIVEDLLSLSRIEHEAERGSVPLDAGPVADLLRRVVQAFEQAAAARGIALAVECPEDLAAPMNAALLEQAVGNLVDNAIKYGDERTRVTVAAARRGDAVEIHVRDQGPGIEKKHLARVFERFYRVDQARSRAMGGTGLGLAIVKHIALAHRGAVAVESTPGHGSTFTIRLPAA